MTVLRPINADRCLHVLDLENLLEGAVSVRGLRTLWAHYLATGLVGADDQVFAGCGATYGPWAALSLAEEPLRLVVGGYGPDAADIALLDMVPASWVVRCFKRVIIGSADHGFAPWAKELADNGVHVLQVLPPGRPSWILGNIADVSYRLSVQPPVAA